MRIFDNFDVFLLPHLKCLCCSQLMYKTHACMWKKKFHYNHLVVISIYYYIYVSPSGIFVALALRFDVSRGKQPQYFKSAFVGYTVGLVLTIVVMNWFQAAQVTDLFHLFFFLLGMVWGCGTIIDFWWSIYSIIFHTSNCISFASLLFCILYLL